MYGVFDRRAAVAIVALLTSFQAFSAESRVRFDVHAGPLSVALNQLAEAGGVQFLYSSGLADGLQSPGLSGTFSVNEAIARVLTGTGLTYRFIDARTVAIEKLDTATARVL